MARRDPNTPALVRPFRPSPADRASNAAGWHSHNERSVDAKQTASRLRRFKTVKSQLLRDRGNDPTQAQITLADNAAALAVWLEEQIADHTSGARELGIGPVTTAVNSLRRVLETLGIERKAKDVTPTLSEYIAKHPTAIEIDGTTTPQ
jgi:hypothetical protein